VLIFENPTEKIVILISSLCSYWCPGSENSDGNILKFGTAVADVGGKRKKCPPNTPCRGSGGKKPRIGTAVAGIGVRSCGEACKIGCPPTLPCRYTLQHN